MSFVFARRSLVSLDARNKRPHGWCFFVDRLLSSFLQKIAHIRVFEVAGIKVILCTRGIMFAVSNVCSIPHCYLTLVFVVESSSVFVNTFTYMFIFFLFSHFQFWLPVHHSLCMPFWETNWISPLSSQRSRSSRVCVCLYSSCLLSTAVLSMPWLV